ncbi:MAG: DUF167 domain-containing protein [Candidatus Woesearchaeota archaeon]
MNLQEIFSHISGNYLAIIVKPSSSKTEIIGWDELRKALRVNIHAKPDNNEANEEVVKFFSKLLKKKVSIKSGTRSREKLIFIKDMNSD